jgi:type IV pilus assembly protein PilM
MKPVLGIDIGTDSLKLALVKDRTVKATAIASVPQNLVRDGRVVSPETMAELIRDTMRKNRIRANDAALVLPPSTTFVRNVTVPQMTADQLSYNLPFEFRDYITDELKNYVYDYAVLSNEVFLKEEEEPADPTMKIEEAETSEVRPKMELLAAATSIAALAESRAMLRKAGLKLVKAAPVVASFIGLIRGMDDSMRPQSDEYGFLELGHDTVRLHIFKGEHLEATRELETGLSTVESAIADAYNVDIHIAHTYLTTNFDECRTKGVCQNAFQGIAVELMRALNFYSFSNRNSVLNDIWICGGGAAIAELRNAIGEAVEMKLHPAKELVRNGDEVEHCYSLIQAIGAAQY